MVANYSLAAKSLAAVVVVGAVCSLAYLYVDLRRQMTAAEDEQESLRRQIGSQEDRLQAVEQLARPDIDSRLIALEERIADWAPKLTESFKYLYSVVNAPRSTVFLPDIQSAQRPDGTTQLCLEALAKHAANDSTNFPNGDQTRAIATYCR